MAYQNVSTPIFYINTLEWLSASKASELPTDHYRTLPVSPSSYGEPEGESYTPQPVHGTFSDKSFVALLGHNLHKRDLDLYPDTTQWRFWVSVIADGNSLEGATGKINFNTYGTAYYADYNGFSIATFNGNGISNIALGSLTHFEIGSIVMGTYYEMPHSPDLSLTLTREYGGTKTIDTKGGASLSNTMWSKAANWGDLPAWELGGSGFSNNNAWHMAKSGRRVWDLSFSYLQDSDVWPDTSNMNNYETTHPDGTIWSSSSGLAVDENAVFNEDTFYSQVIHKTNGGQLPFIFNPAGGGDNPNNNPDQFAICKFDMKSFQFKQVANSVYNVKCKIREVW